jgi:hypothetical protein
MLIPVICSMTSKHEGHTNLLLYFKELFFRYRRIISPRSFALVYFLGRGETEDGKIN